jgi:hypothetical protein
MGKVRQKQGAIKGQEGMMRDFGGSDSKRMWEWRSSLMCLSQIKAQMGRARWGGERGRIMPHQSGGSPIMILVPTSSPSPACVIPLLS